MASYNLPSVTKSLSRDHLPQLFALLWNIPYLFLDHNRFQDNLKPSFYSFRVDADVDVNGMPLSNI